MDIKLALWILMARCFSTRASVATVWTHAFPVVYWLTRWPLRDYGSNFTSVFFWVISQIDFFRTSCEIGQSWVPQNPIDDKPNTLALVMAWCHNQRRQCWPRSILPCDITMPQRPKQNGQHYYYFKFDYDAPCTCHDISAVVVCAILWHDMIIIVHVRATCNFMTNFTMIQYIITQFVSQRISAT